MLNRISIKDGVYINGVEVTALKEVDIHSDVDNVSEVTLKFLAKVEGLDTVDKSPTFEMNRKKKVIVDVNGGEYIFDNLDAFRIARNSSKKAATVVDDATSDDFNELIGETCEFWFDGATKYTRMLVIGTDLSKEYRTIFCFEEEQLYFLDKNNKQINF